MLDRGPGFQIAPRYQAPAVTPATMGGYMGQVPIPDFSLPTPHRIASAMQRVTAPPVGSPAALWAAGKWGQKKETPIEELLASTTYRRA
jgi:hypothetical protein